MFIYRNEGEWLVGPVPGKKRGWLFNDATTETLPLSGWKVADGKGNWPNDPTLKIASGPLVTSCNSITIKARGEAAAKQPESLGEFKKCDKMWSGRPVFVNEHGEYLHSGTDGWNVSDTFGAYAIAGLPSHHCPAAASKWIFAATPDDKPANISIFCPVHSKK